MIRLLPLRSVEDLDHVLWRGHEERINGGIIGSVSYITLVDLILVVVVD